MTNTTAYDVTAIGNALVDFLCPAEDLFLEKMNIEKGGFCLIDIDQAKNLYQNMGPAKEISGGSAANTIAALAEIGASTGFIGATASDQVGTIFKHDICSLGVNFKQIIHDPVEYQNQETGRCYILVSPDASRSMNTYLGVAGFIPEEKLDFSIIEQSKILYVEGYMWVIDETKQAILKAVDHAHQHNRKAALTLSDVFCVNSFRDEFLDLVENKFDIIFANEAEACALFQTNDLETAIQAAQKTGKIFAITCGENGSVIVQGDHLTKQDAVKPAQLIDTTGAGDAFAAGFLYGITQNMSYSNAAHIGSLIASEVISHFGARSEKNLKELLTEHRS